jgi:hypothetical protein
VKKLFLVCLLAATVGTAWAQWKYETKVDQMTDATMKFASIKSANQLAFTFPYQGGASVWLVLRKKGPKESLYLQLSKGQFLHSEGLMVRFDDSPALTLGAGEPSDNSTDWAFLEFPARANDCSDQTCEVDQAEFIKRLTTSTRLRIQATFYDQGKRLIEFKPKGLKWPE